MSNALEAELLKILEKRIRQSKKRLDELAAMLIDTRRPDFDALASERNSLSVEIEVMKQQLEGKWTPKHNGPIYSIPNIN